MYRYSQGGASPVHLSGKHFPWLVAPRLILKLVERRTYGVPPGLFVLNAICQRLLGINEDVPWNVHFTSRVMGRVEIGRNVWRSFSLSGSCYIQGVNGIFIDDDTIFAPGVKMVSANHATSKLDKFEPAPAIRIGKRVWLGANAVVLPAVELGDDVVVGAGAVVTKSFPANSKLVGVPARHIG